MTTSIQQVAVVTWNIGCAVDTTGNAADWSKVMSPEIKTFITHLAGFARFNVVHSDDPITLEVNALAFGSCITQLRALLHHPRAHTLKHLKSTKCVINIT